MTLEEASDKLFTPIDQKINAEKLDDVNFEDLWYSFIHTARRTHSSDVNKHAALCDLVDAFKTHSIPGNEKYNYLYSLMTGFGMCRREAYNDAPVPGVSFDIEVTAWTNLNYFYALLAGREVSDLSRYFAIWAMREALERPYSDGDDATAVQKYETHVPAAAAWIFGAFRVLYNKEEDLTPTDDTQGDPARGGELWRGKSEFSKERWDFWKERFAQVGKMDGINENTKNVARDAVNAMERAATFEKI